MFSEIIETRITFGSTVTFFLRMLSISEENDFRQRVFGIEEKDRAEKEYGANVALLKELSAKMPEGLFPLRPKDLSASDRTIYQEDIKSAAEAVEKFFAVRSVVKERIAYYAVRSYFLRLQPTESFF